jgi:hypothetical protein
MYSLLPNIHYEKKTAPQEMQSSVPCETQALEEDQSSQTIESLNGITHAALCVLAIAQRGVFCIRWDLLPGLSMM